MAGTVWSRDEARATEIARAVHTAIVGINHYAIDLDALQGKLTRGPPGSGP
jgi:acyl-CoA reductase-like NAD-dependent aldehyde dehydrogenase